MYKKKLSVVTIVYNDVTQIERTIQSVLNQTESKYIEYIVIDGASTDGTSEIIKKYAHKISTYICEPDTGIYNAMNKGLKVATGDYIQYINSGDTYSSNTVVCEVINRIGNGLPDIVYGHYRETHGENTIGTVIPCRKPDKIWYGPIAAHQSILYCVKHLKKYAIKYDESYKIAADYKFTAEALKYAENILKSDICISNFDVTGVSSTNQNQGLSEANRVRREVFGWGKFKILVLTIILLCARITKQYCNPIYKKLRH